MRNNLTNLAASAWVAWYAVLVATPLSVLVVVATACVKELFFCGVFGCWKRKRHACANPACRVSLCGEHAYREHDGSYRCAECSHKSLWSV